MIPRRTTNLIHYIIIARTLVRFGFSSAARNGPVFGRSTGWPGACVHCSSADSLRSVSLWHSVECDSTTIAADWKRVPGRAELGWFRVKNLPDSGLRVKIHPSTAGACSPLIMLIGPEDSNTIRSNKSANVYLVLALAKTVRGGRKVTTTQQVPLHVTLHRVLGVKA